MVEEVEGSTTLNLEQKKILTDLIGTVSSMVNYFDTHKNFSMTTPLEDIWEIGSSPKIKDLFQAFFQTLSKIFYNRFFQGYFFWSNDQPWDWVREATAPMVDNTTELILGTTASRIDNDEGIPLGGKMRALVLEGLWTGELSSWLSILLSKEDLLTKWYEKDSIFWQAPDLLTKILHTLDTYPFRLT
eukprot:TRINITY_DN22316_c0_g1_i1.p1 TRINITY_DN22316_c0_g1~~TRINITY_DN22316_c0_g1_i1.p1  ORF type:complete len:211 (-),score=61.35 TRINITY_DN22316_c0_g1_i1:33-593(-)